MINNIQALRGFAAVNVLIYHIIEISRSYSQSSTFLQPLNNWGASGVDVFFVISGFIMVYTQNLNARKPLDFILNRIIRIVPLYWLLTLLITFAFILNPDLFRKMQLDLSSIISSLLFISAFSNQTAPVVIPGWTLELEMLFYLIFGLSLFFKAWFYRFFFVAFLLLLISYFNNSWILLEFIFGFAIALFYKNYKLKPIKARFIAIFGFFALTLSLFLKSGECDQFRIFVWGVPASLIVLGLIFVNQTRSIIIVKLGEISYSVYLIQAITVPVFYKFSSSILGNYSGNLLAILCFIFTISVALIVHFMFDIPVSSKLKRYVFAK